MRALELIGKRGLNKGGLYVGIKVLAETFRIEYWRFLFIKTRGMKNVFQGSPLYFLYSTVVFVFFCEQSDWCCWSTI